MMSSALHTTGESDPFAANGLPLRVLIVTSELVPFAQAGGLGEMVAGLAAGSARLGVDVRVVMPRYGWIDPIPMYKLPDPVACDYNEQEWWTAIYQASLPSEPKVPVYFVDRLDFYDRPGIYGQPDGNYHDNELRFGILSSAAFALGKALHWKPHIVHGHDWPTAASVSLARHKERLSGFAETRTVLTVHNLAHRGPELTGNRSVLWSGLQDAHRIVFVSPSFASEALRADSGFGFEDLLNSRKSAVTGILNGIDYERWNPERDSYLVKNFDAETLETKELVRKALLAEFDLPNDDNRPLFGMVSRLDAQKGFDELLDYHTGCLESLLREGRFHLLIVGTGERAYESRLAELARRYRNMAVAFRFHEALAHRVQAGSDFFLMPSRFEPCGLNQMYSLRYGTIPVVTATGGLADTVRDVAIDGSNGTGVVIDHPRPSEVRRGIERALALWERGPKAVTAVRRRAMAERFSIEDMARQYLHLYRELIPDVSRSHR